MAISIMGQLTLGFTLNVSKAKVFAYIYISLFGWAHKSAFKVTYELIPTKSYYINFVTFQCGINFTFYILSLMKSISQSFVDNPKGLVQLVNVPHWF